MSLITKLLENPQIWQLSQKIFGDDKEKMELYRSVIPKKGKLLDFGCSNGNTFPAFSDFDYFGFDTDKTMILDAKKKYANFPNAHFFAIDILKAKPKVANFDYILFALTGHHLSDKTLINIFKKLPSFLKKNGRIFYFDSIRNNDKDSHLLKFILNLDQGKFIRTKKEYKKIKQLLPKSLKPVKEKYFQVKNTLMPQPEYLFWELKKIK